MSYDMIQVDTVAKTVREQVSLKLANSREKREEKRFKLVQLRSILI